MEACGQRSPRRSNSGGEKLLKSNKASVARGNLPVSHTRKGVVDTAKKRFDDEILRPLLRSTASTLAINEGKISTEHPLKYLIRAKMFERERIVEEPQIPQEFATILKLQSTNGQWMPSKELHQSLGDKIPAPPLGIPGWRWASALAVVFLRRRPDLIENTIDAHSRAMMWVDEPLLAEAHVRLPPTDLNYPVDDEAIREGRWQQYMSDALEAHGYAYFVSNDDGPVTRADKEDPSDDSNGQYRRPDLQERAKLGADSSDKVVPHHNVMHLPEAYISRTQFRSLSPSSPQPRRMRARRVAVSRAKEQSCGLLLELEWARRVARNSFKEGDRIESCYRRPNKFLRPRVDTGRWHPGRITSVGKDSRLDVAFKDGDAERLCKIPSKYVRLAPEGTTFCSESTVGRGAKAAEGTANVYPLTRRKLAHIAAATSMIRRSWQDPVTLAEELSRFERIREENTRGRKEWYISSSAATFGPAKRLQPGGTSDETDSRRCRRERVAARDGTCHGRRTRAQSLLTPQVLCGKRRALAERDAHKINSKTKGNQATPALLVAESSLIASAVAYDRCVSTVQDCIARGAAAFRSARTYSEQQAAFEETTEILGPARPTREGYSDWRGRPVAGLQSATLKLVEDMEVWAEKWVAARNTTNGDSLEPKDNEELTSSDVAESPPFLWGGKPLALTITTHTESLVGGNLELRGWYGPGFPIQHNPFCLAYPIEDRPPTPCNALVSTQVNGETISTVSPMLLEKRKAEEVALKAILDKQAAAPSWWPATGGIMGESHYDRIRKAEKILLREQKKAVARCFRDSNSA